MITKLPKLVARFWVCFSGFHTFQGCKATQRSRFTISARLNMQWGAGPQYSEGFQLLVFKTRAGPRITARPKETHKSVHSSPQGLDFKAQCIILS